MARRQKSNLIKRIIIVGVVLAVFELGYILLKRSDTPLSIEEAINQKISKMSISPERKITLKVQLAINDFMIANQGNPPKELAELVPKYFDRLPDDPATGKPFDYKVDGRKYQLGAATATLSASTSKPGDAPRGDSNVMSREEQQALIATLNNDERKERPAYDPTGKRDPFRPFDVSPDLESNSEKTPLERYDASQWFLTAVIDSAEGPTAMLEDPAGHGYSVKKGSTMGLRGGQVVEITSDRVAVLETEVDFTGETRTKTIDIRRRGTDSIRSPRK